MKNVKLIRLIQALDEMFLNRHLVAVEEVGRYWHRSPPSNTMSHFKVYIEGADFLFQYGWSPEANTLDDLAYIIGKAIAEHLKKAMEGPAVEESTEVHT